MFIVHIFWSFTIGGAETMLVDIMNEQAKKENVALIIINNSYSHSLLRDLDLRIKVVLLNRKPKSLSLYKLIKLNLFLLRYKPDVIHCHNYNLSKVLLPFLLKKTILTVHGFNRPLTSKNKYSRVTAISNAIFQDLFGKGVRNLSVVHNGINIQLIEQKVTFNKIIQIVCVGRLEHQVKGQDTLLKAFSKLITNIPAVKLHFIGAGTSEKHLKELASNLKISEEVIFHGIENRSKLYSTLCSYDILVQPSVHEGFGLSVAEAMIARLPVVISRATGLVEITNSGKLASVVFKQSEDEYYLALHRLILKITNNPIVIEQKLDEAAKFVADNFSLSKTCLEYKKLYESLT